MYSAILQLWRRSTYDVADAKKALRNRWVPGLPTLRVSLPLLTAELRRARRYERPLALLAIGFDKSVATHDAGIESISFLPPTVLATQMVFYVLGSLVRDSLRETDLAVYSAEHHLYVVLLTESGEAEARCAVDRISRVIHDRLGVSLCAGVAEFPHDGLTLEDLFDHARNTWDGSTRVDRRPLVKEVSSA